MKGEEPGQLILEELLITEDGLLVMHDGAHVSNLAVRSCT